MVLTIVLAIEGEREGEGEGDQGGMGVEVPSVGVDDKGSDESESGISAMSNIWLRGSIMIKV